MLHKVIPSLTLLVFLAGCSYPERDVPPPAPSLFEITGRDEGEGKLTSARPPVYRANVPSSWEQQAPSPEQSIADTTKANCSFLIRDEDETIHITVHSFPSNRLEERIPPGAQVSRWRKQLTDLDPTTLVVSPYGHGGFSGFHFEACGYLHKKPVMVLAWAMQLDPTHYQTLNHLSGSSEERRLFRQMAADYTIKASGPPALVEKHKQEIIAFARSFELIQEIPHQS